jgi:hypothetical protein
MVFEIISENIVSFLIYSLVVFIVAFLLGIKVGMRRESQRAAIKKLDKQYRKFVHKRFREGTKTDSNMHGVLDRKSTPMVQRPSMLSGYKVHVEDIPLNSSTHVVRRSTATSLPASSSSSSSSSSGALFHGKRESVTVEGGSAPTPTHNLSQIPPAVASTTLPTPAASISPSSPLKSPLSPITPSSGSRGKIKLAPIASPTTDNSMPPTNKSRSSILTI